MSDPAPPAPRALPAPPALPAPLASRLKAPSWLDGRLVIGVILVLLSVVVGAKVVASSSHYDQLWAASRDLAPGSTITSGDLVAVKVRFHDHGGGYFATSGVNLVGRTTVSPLQAGQLISVGALPATAPVPDRLVTVPVAKLHMPHDNDLRGQQVDLYVTLKGPAGDEGAKAPQLVLANVTVADTVSDSSLGGSNGSAVVLEVPVAYVDAVVGAVESGSIDLVRVPTDQVASTPSPGTFVPPPIAGASPISSAAAAPVGAVPRPAGG